MSAETANLEFAEFLVSGSAPCPTDVLDQLEVHVRCAMEFIAIVEKQIAEHNGNTPAGAIYIHGSSIENYTSIWDRVVMTTYDELIKDSGVDVGPKEAFCVDALQLKRGGKSDVVTCLKAWTADKMRSHYRRVVGDPRQKRIEQLKAKTMALCNHCHNPLDRVWGWSCNVHHESPWGSISSPRLRLTYSSSTIGEWETLIRYIIHLATGQDPADIVIPAIYGWTDGEKEWPRSKLFLRIKKPFAGCEWMRWCAGGGIEFCFEEKARAMIVAQYLEYKEADKLRREAAQRERDSISLS